MRIGWYVTQRGVNAKPWVLEKKDQKGRVQYYRRKNGDIARWKNKQAAQLKADTINREEALS